MKLFRTLAAATIMMIAFLAPVAAGTVKVFAAASLKNALDEIAADWNASTGKDAVMVFAGSSALAKQIVEGAPADIFISADLAWMDDLQSRNLIDPATRGNLLGNSLVIVAPAGTDVNIDLSKPVDLAALLAGGKLAIADVKAVPAGRYAKAALESLGLWTRVEPHLAQSENVRAALAFVARGEAPLGIVYGSDAMVEAKVRVVGTFPAQSHPPIVYPAARIANAVNSDADEFLRHLRSGTARGIFESHGFTVLD